MNFYNHRKLGFIYVGIDCHKATHTAVIISPFNDKLDTLTFKNTKEDFNKLLDMVSKYTSKDVSAVFGLEDTKHLGHSLCSYLLCHNQTVKHINSNYTYNERKKHPIIDKTDELDAECIAKVTLDELDNLPDAKDDEIYWTLKQLIKMKRTISNNNTKLKNKLHAQLLHHYPNYKEFFSKIDHISALDFWETYPSPDMIKNLTAEELKESVITKGKFPLAKANKILELIKDYDYKEVVYQDNRNMLIKTIVKNIKSNNKQLEDFEKEIIDLYDKLDIKLHTFIGLTKITSAEIVSEIGNIKRFSNSSKLAKYCGVAPVNFSSGNHDKTVRNEYGNRHLNGYIYYLACRSICTGKGSNTPHNPIFLDYYYKKIEDGKTKRQALTCVMRRIINIIFNILSKGVPYEHPDELNKKCLDNIKQKNEEKTDKV